MVKIFDLATAKLAQLPEAVQEQLGRELLEHIEGLSRLRNEIEIGVRELDERLGEELDIESLVAGLNAELPL
jgi:hypothetical protein